MSQRQKEFCLIYKSNVWILLMLFASAKKNILWIISEPSSTQ